MSIEALLDRSVEIRRPSRIGDGKGGDATTFVAVSTVPGRVRPASAREAFVADRPEAQVSHVAYLPTGSDVRTRDRLDLGGKTYEVVAVRTPSKPSHLEVDLLERQRGR